MRNTPKLPRTSPHAAALSTQEQLRQVEREMNYYRTSMDREIDQLSDRVSAWITPSRWLAQGKRWLAQLLSSRTNTLIAGGIVAGVVLLGWMFSGRDDERTDSLPARREGPSFFGRMVWTALQTFLLFYARKVLTEYLRERPEATASPAPEPAPTTPFSQTP
jgi:hypothetical protein